MALFQPHLSLDSGIVPGEKDQQNQLNLNATKTAPTTPMGGVGLVPRRPPLSRTQSQHYAHARAASLKRRPPSRSPSQRSIPGSAYNSNTNLNIVGKWIWSRQYM